MWSAAVTGGQFEGITATFSVMPGLGMLANGHLTSFDVVPDQARRHPVTKSLERHVSPLAGSMSFHKLLMKGLLPYCFFKILWKDKDDEWKVIHGKSPKILTGHATKLVVLVERLVSYLNLSDDRMASAARYRSPQQTE